MSHSRLRRRMFMRAVAVEDGLRAFRHESKHAAIHMDPERT